MGLQGIHRFHPGLRRALAQQQGRPTALQRQLIRQLTLMELLGPHKPFTEPHNCILMAEASRYFTLPAGLHPLDKQYKPTVHLISARDSTETMSPHCAVVSAIYAVNVCILTCCMAAENGIAPTTPGRGKLAAPFKLVAPNADMKDIPATFVVRTTPGLGLDATIHAGLVIRGFVRELLACLLCQGIVRVTLNLIVHFHETVWVLAPQAQSQRVLAWRRELCTTGRAAPLEAGLQAAAQSRKRAMTMVV